MRRSVMDWLVGQRAALVLDGLEISRDVDLAGEGVVISLPVIADQRRTAELRRRWPGIHFIVATEVRNLVIAILPCEPTLPAILAGVGLGRRIRQFAMATHNRN